MLERGQALKLGKNLKVSNEIQMDVRQIRYDHPVNVYLNPLVGGPVSRGARVLTSNDPDKSTLVHNSGRRLG